MIEKKHTYFKEFYTYYLAEHRNFTSRVLHFIGCGLAILFLLAALLFHNFYFFLAVPIVSLGFAWVGDFFFEKNKAATFKQPLYSFAGDFMLFFDLFSGKEAFHVKEPKMGPGENSSVKR
jgi:hypothetical protein